jgi:hypothetical protein
VVVLKKLCAGHEKDSPSLQVSGSFRAIFIRLK